MPSVNSLLNKVRKREWFHYIAPNLVPSQIFIAPKCIALLADAADCDPALECHSIIQMHKSRLERIIAGGSLVAISENHLAGPVNAVWHTMLWEGRFYLSDVEMFPYLT